MSDLEGDKPHLDDYVEAWRSEGVTVVDRLVPGAAIASALAECRRLTPGPYEAAAPSRQDFGGAPAEGPAFRPGQFGGTTVFAFPDSPALNAIVLHPELIRFARAALGTDDIRLYQARSWSKYAGQVNYEQPMHRDLNHSLVPTRSEAGFWHLECFLYLNDVDESMATRVVPRTADFDDPGVLRTLTPEDNPGLFAAEQPAAGLAGSLMAYRSDTWHRAVDLPPGSERHVLILGFKPAGLDWVGFDPLPPLAVNRDFLKTAANWTADQLAVMGIPRPGHPYWTAKGIEEFGRQYAGLDVEPWRRALSQPT